MRWRTCLSALLTSVLLCVLAQEPRAQGCNGRSDGPISGIELRGDLGLVANGSLLRIVDVSQPLTIEVLAELRMPAAILGMAFADDDLAVVASDAGGCRLVDLSEPGSPSSGDAGLDGRVTAVAAATDRAFAVEQLSDGPAPQFRFNLLDVSDRAAPSLLATLTADGTVEDMAVLDDLVYLARSDRTLVEIDVGNPNHLRQRTYTGAFNGQTGFPVRIAAQDGTVYVTAIQTWLEYYSTVFALGLPVWDRPWSFTEMGVLITDVEAGEDYLVFADLIRGMTVLDISVPEPEWLFVYRPDLLQTRIVDVELADDDLAFVVDESRGLQILDTTDLSAIREIGVLGLDGWHPLEGMAEEENLLVGTSVADGLTVLDIEDPVRPRLRSTDPSIGRGNSVVISGHVAYVASQQRGVEVIDLSLPEAPLLIGTIATVGDARYVAVAGNQLVAVSDETSVFEISDPAQPELASVMGLTGLPQPWDGFLLIAASDGLRVVDLSDPSSPAVIGFLESDWQSPGSEIVSVAANDDLAFVASYTRNPWDGRLHVIDLHDPHSPSEIGALELEFPAFGLTATGDVLLAVIYNRGLLSIDVSDPTRPRLVHTFFPDAPDPTGLPQTWSEVYGLLGSGAIAYTGLTNPSSTSSMLRIVDISNPSRPVHAGTLEGYVGRPLCEPGTALSFADE